MYKLLVGIGNPGEKYYYTRHNVGFLTVDAFINHFQQKFEKNLRLKSLITSFFIEENKLVVIKPLTFMNFSGEAVLSVMNYFKINKSDILVISDDINLDLGSVRLKAKGSSGGHNGLKSIIEKLGSLDYPRLRIGIGEPKSESLSEYVLNEFSSYEKDQLSLVIEKIVPFLTLWVKSSFQETELIFSKLKQQGKF